MGRGAGRPVRQHGGVRVPLEVGARLLARHGATLAGVGQRLGPSGPVAVDALERGLGRATLRLGAPAAPWAVPLRWSPASALALVPDPQDRGVLDVLPLPSPALPELVARIVDLGPRPEPMVTAPLLLPAEVLDVWLRGAPRSVLDAAVDDPGSRRVLVALRHQLRVTWAVTSELPTSDGRLVSRAIRVVDAGDAGLWLLHRVPEAGGVALLDGVTSTAVWDLLAGVLATRPVREVAA